MSHAECMMKIRELQSLSQHAQKLGEEQREHDVTSQRLEERIKRGEISYGDMLRKSLELQRALETRRLHISQDRVALEKELSSSKAKSDELIATVSKIKSITAEMNVVAHATT